MGEGKFVSVSSSTVYNLEGGREKGRKGCRRWVETAHLPSPHHPRGVCEVNLGRPHQPDLQGKVRFLSFLFTNASLEKPRLIALICNRVCGQWRRTNMKERGGGAGAPVRRKAPKFFSWRSVQFGQFVVCSSRCPMESAPLLWLCSGLWEAVIKISIWHSRHWHGFSTLCSHTH